MRALANLATYLGEGLLQIVFPMICWSCGRSAPPAGQSFCTACAAALTTDVDLTCPRCCNVIGPHTDLGKGCPECRDRTFFFDAAIRLTPYSKIMRDLILRMKHHTGEPLAEVLGRLWAEHALARLRSLQPDLVVPVPLHWRRRWARGYNQAETLARAVARQLQLPFQPRCLQRIRNTPRQASIESIDARRRNPRGAFQTRRGIDLHEKTVLLIDDVLTTGSTASEAARPLKRAGAKRVVVAVLAHGR